MHRGQEPTTTAEVSGIGHSVKRKEDPRFIRGQGNYIDDVKLPGMLYMDIVRSPYAHATIKSIDATEALTMPGVLAVITGKDLEAAGLAWMPTLIGDTQMVLPTDTWCTSRRKSRRSSRRPATRRPTRSRRSRSTTSRWSRSSIRSRRSSPTPLRPDRGPDKANNHIWHWESGDRAATDAALEASDVVVPRTSTSRASTWRRSRRAAASPASTRSAAS